MARRLGIDLSTLVRWVQRYNAQGEKGLHRKKGQGRKRVLNSERMQKIKQWVSEEGRGLDFGEGEGEERDRSQSSRDLV